MLEAISKVQVYFENDIYMDYDIEWFIFTTLHVIHVYRPVFQGESEFCGFRNARGHHEGPGVPREQHTHGTTTTILNMNFRSVSPFLRST